MHPLGSLHPLIRLYYLLTAKNPFPFTRAYMAVAQDEDSFYIVGGEDWAGDANTIHRYEATNESWKIMPNRMKHGRTSPTAMMVKRSIFPKCD